MPDAFMDRASLRAVFASIFGVMYTKQSLCFRTSDNHCASFFMICFFNISIFLKASSSCKAV
jgi:hypothetical protein